MPEYFYCDADKETGVKSSNRIAVTKHYETVYKEVKRGLKLRQRDTDDTFKHDRVLDIGRQIGIRASI